MEIILIVGIILFILIGIIIFKIIGKIVKTLSILMSILTIVMLIGGIFVYLDAKDLKENFSVEKKLFVLDYDDVLLSGFTLKDMAVDGMPEVLSKEVLSEYSNYYSNNDMKSIQGEEYYKVFVFKKELFDDVLEMDIGNVKLSKYDIDAILVSNDALNLVVDKMLMSQGVPLDNTKYREEISKELKSNEAVKGLLVAGLFAKKSKEPTFIFEGLQNETVMVYPETIIFKLIKIVPFNYMSKFVDMGSEDGNAGQI